MQLRPFHDPARRHAATVGDSFAFLARGWAVDAVIVVSILIGSAWAATAYLRVYDAGGGTRHFYQRFFDVAVMDACGKGFVHVANQSEIHGLAEFLEVRSESFNCRSIPDDVRTTSPDLFQASSRYLMKSAALFWRLRGVSWAALQPLFAIGFAATAVAAYALMRVAMRPWLAGILTVAFASSGSQFNNLPHLRDYLKAPFVISVLAFAAWIATRHLSRRSLLVCSAAAGAVAGIGIGVRTDLLLGIPAAIFAIWMSDPNEEGHRVRLKILATVIFLTICILSAFPVLRAYAGANNGWHVAVLGLMSPFDDSLGIESPFYSLGHFNNDTYVNAIINSYATHAHRASRYLTLDSKAYEVVGRQYWLRVMLIFPADVLFRIYASAIEVINLPFWTQVPQFLHHSGLLRFYEARAAILGPLWGAGPVLAVASIMTMALSSIRLATWWSFAILYFAGTPAIQFDVRHYFHLEVIGWLVLGFLCERALRAALPLGRASAVINSGLGRLREGASALVFTVTVIVLMIGVLAGLRAYQTDHVRRMLREYQAAPKDAVTMRVVQQPKGWVSFSPDLPTVASSRDAVGLVEMEYIVAEIAGGCEDDVVPIRVRYYASEPFVDFSETLAVVTPESSSEPVRVYVPVYYDHMGVNGHGRFEFSHLEMRKDQASCLDRLWRIRDLSRLPLPLFVTLRPGWAAERAYQSFGSAGDVIRIVSAPESMSVPGALFRRPLRPAFPAGVAYKSSIVERLDSEWVVSGKADGTSTYLAEGRYEALDKGTLLLGRGEVISGGFEVGLLREDRWVQQLNIDYPGRFRLAVEVPEDGVYKLVLANYLPRWRNTSFRFAQVGWLMPSEPKDRAGTRRDARN